MEGPHLTFSVHAHALVESTGNYHIFYEERTYLDLAAGIPRFLTALQQRLHHQLHFQLDLHLAIPSCSFNSKSSQYIRMV